MNTSEIFKGILSADANTRKNSENIISEKKNIPFNDALNFFLEGIKDNDKTISQLATLLFKKTFLDNEVFLKSLDKTTAENLVNNVFFPLVTTDKDWKFLERVAENIARLYTIADLSNSIKQIVTLFGNENHIIRQFAIFLLDSTADLGLIKEEIIQINLIDFSKLFTQGLNDSDPKVRILTLKATTSMLNSISNKSLVMEFSSLAKPIINSLVYCLQNDEDGTKSKACLETLNFLTELHPKLWKEDLESFLDIICEILISNQISKQNQQSAFQLVLSFTKSTPAYVRKSTVFKEKFIPILMNLLKDVDNVNDLKTWTSLTEDNDNDHDEMHFAAREGIELFALDLGGKFILDLLMPYISKFLSSNDWLENHAAFVAIAWLTESCSKQFKGDLENLLK